jgi:hypothetical protein
MKTTKEKFYRVKKESISSLGKTNPPRKNEFEIYLIQEGVKQILFAQGNKQISSRISVEGSLVEEWNQFIPKEMIQFLLDYDIIEEYESDIKDYQTNKSY